jgi:zinc finger protein
VRYEFFVNSEEDLAVRVIRSMSASLEIPELGVRIDPGPACQGFVSNVEGVLDRIDHIVRSALLWGNDEERKNAQELLAKTVAVRNAALPVTLIIKDPCGNSAIVSERAERTKYEPEK